MNPTVLVITTVHTPDDTRIRERLIRTLSQTWNVIYGAPLPGPTDISGLSWLPLRGGRLRRGFEAFRLLLREKWDVAVVHDPELIPAAVIARLIRRRPVIFDVHEDLSAQVATKSWVPILLRIPTRWLARALFRLAEAWLTVTLAETGYRKLFRKAHVVFPNYPHFANWPEPVRKGNGRAVYVGDVQEARGILEAIEACGRSGTPLSVIGPTSIDFENRMHRAAQESDAELRLEGRLANPEAVDRIGQASVGLSPLRPLPNYIHSLPTKTLEYLAMGIPVVATDLPGTREALGGLDAVWLVPPGDAVAMGIAIDEAASSNAKEAAYAQAGTVREKYAWPHDEVEEFYLSVFSL